MPYKPAEAIQRQIWKVVTDQLWREMAPTPSAPGVQLRRHPADANSTATWMVRYSGPAALGFMAEHAQMPDTSEERDRRPAYATTLGTERPSSTSDFRPSDFPTLCLRAP